MPAAARPSNVLQTKSNIQQGEPFVSFAPNLPSGGVGAYRDLGIVQDAEIAKTLELSTLRNAQSGVSVIARQDVRSFDAQLDVGLSEISAENLQLYLASATLDAVTADAADAITNEAFTLTDDAEDYIVLANHLIDQTAGNITLNAATITAEAVGTGDGVTATFDLAYKVDDFSDITVLLDGGVDRTAALVNGAPASAAEIGVTTGTGATSGRLTWFAGDEPANGAAIVATYQPGWVFVQGVTDGLHYIIDGKGGRVRLYAFDATKAAATHELLAEQPMEIDYLYNRLAHNTITPFTQFSFPGRARVELLTDIGTNIIWPIPSVTLRLTDDAFAFSREDYLVGNLSLILEDVGGSAPFGTAQIFSEAQAAS